MKPQYTNKSKKSNNFVRKLDKDIKRIEKEVRNGGRRKVVKGEVPLVIQYPSQKKTQIKFGKKNKTAKMNQMGKQSYKQNSLVFTDEEFVTQISSAINYQTISFNIDISNQNLFSWLAPQANLWEQYEIIDLRFEFVSTSGNSIASTNTALGQIGMFIQYDADAVAPGSLKEALNYQGVNAQVPSKNFSVRYDGSKLPIKRFYINRDPTVTDQKFSSPGNLIILAYGSQQVNIVGNLKIYYKIRLINKILQLENTVTTAGYAGNVAVTNLLNLPLGNQTIGVTGSSNARFGVETLTLDSAPFNTRIFFCSFNWTITPAAYGTPVPTAFINCAQFSPWQDGNLSNYYPVASGLQPKLGCYFGVVIPVGSIAPTVSFNGVALTTTTATLEVLITEVPAAIYGYGIQKQLELKKEKKLEDRLYERLLEKMEVMAYGPQTSIQKAKCNNLSHEETKMDDEEFEARLEAAYRRAEQQLEPQEKSLSDEPVDDDYTPSEEDLDYEERVYRRYRREFEAEQKAKSVRSKIPH